MKFIDILLALQFACFVFSRKRSASQSDANKEISSNDFRPVLKPRVPNCNNRTNFLSPEITANSLEYPKILTCTLFRDRKSVV